MSAKHFCQHPLLIYVYHQDFDLIKLSNENELFSVVAFQSNINDNTS